MKQVTAIVIGAGDRGNVYANYSLKYPFELKIVGVAEPNEKRRKIFSEKFGINKKNQFSTYEEILEKDQMADIAIITTQDNMHYEPAVKAFYKGYHILLEKPMSNKIDEIINLVKIAKKEKRIFQIGHVLRYTPFFLTIKNIIRKGQIGDIMAIQHNENIGYWHFAHSYVRGNWRKESESSPMILAKCCHDMDILVWLCESEVAKISSFGSLRYFTEKNKPQGAPKRCIDGCIYEKECPFSALKLYLGENINWPTSVISTDLSFEGRMKALQKGPYGRCVYQCDNDVVDHQVVNIEFENGITAAFTVSAFTAEFVRTIKIMGTKGELRGHMGKNEIELIDFSTSNVEVIKPGVIEGGHGGGDVSLMRHFVFAVQNNKFDEILTTAEESMDSHLMAFAAEKSRLQNIIVDFQQYKKDLWKKF